MKTYKPVTKKTIAWYWRFTRHYPFLFWYGTLGAIAATIITDILPPFIVAQAFNSIQATVSAGQPIVWQDLTIYFWLFTACLIVGVAIWRTEARSVWKYSILAEQRMAEYIFDHLQHMGSRFHANRFGGALVSQTTKFLSSYGRTVADFTWNIVTGITALIGSLIILSFTSWIYAAVFIAIITVYISVMGWRMKKQAPLNHEVASSESDQTAKLADNITNVTTVRSFAGETHENTLFHRQSTETTGKRLHLMNVQLKNELLAHTQTTTMGIVAFGLGLFAIANWDAQVGTLYLTVTYTLGLTNRLWQFLFVMRNINRNFGDAADMTNILEMTPEIQDPENPEPVRIKKGGVAFEDVTFRYSDNKRNQTLFENLSFSIKPGEKIGLVGHSGGGKTTITTLLLRFMDIQKGRIAIDDQDISAIAMTDLRSHITYVPQEPLLFHRSLADNIAYGKPGATINEIKKAAKMAHADEFIELLPEGYDTLVGERGIKLSGGQRQRVALARAMLKDAPILVLDEATSALDSESEVLIQDALWKLMKSKTAIVIAHRLSTVQKMDRILVLDKGQIVEEGSHKELLKNEGIYANLWNHQSGGFLED